MTPDFADRFRAYLTFLALFYAGFFPVYLGGGWLASQADSRYLLHFAWENRIPFLPGAVWVYLSLYPLFLLPLIHLPPAETRRLGWQSLFVLAVAGLVFVLFPAQSEFPQPEAPGLQGWLIATIWVNDTPHNLVPSLHVAFAWIIIMGVRAHAGRVTGGLYLIWLCALITSTLLLHRHYLLDVTSGAALAMLARRVVPLRPSAADQ